MGRVLRLLILLIGLSPAVLMAQDVKAKTYHAIVRSAESKELLDAVICEGQSKEGKTLTYTFSNERGELRLSSSLPIEYIRLRLLGYAPKTIPAQTLLGEKPATIELSPAVEQLREVVVSTQPIRREGDTIRYQVSSFKSEGDKYLADVLRKLPGVSVAENGVISYQGEPINRFYVEGRDLMGGQYGLVSRNLDAETVSSIEVLERNQHIKALRSISRPKQAAINVKLKRSFRLRPFGEIGLSAGLGDKALYGGRAMLANFSPALQLMLNLKGNNMGQHLLEELDDKFLATSFGSDEEGNTRMLSSLQRASLPLPRERYTFGRTYIMSAKALLPLSTDRELKLSFSHGKNKQSGEYSSKDEYHLGMHHLSIEEQALFVPLEYRTTLGVSFEENSDSRYYTSDLSYRGWRNYSLSNIQQASAKHINSDNTADIISSKNQLLLKTASDRVFRLHLNSLYNRSRETMLYREGVTADAMLSERFLHNRFRLEAKGETSSALWGGRLSLEAEAKYMYQSMAMTNELSPSGQFATLGIDSEAGVKARQLQLSFSPSYQHRFIDNKLALSLGLPLTQLYYRAEQDGGKVPTELRTFLSPKFSLRYDASDKWSFDARIGLGDISYRGISSLLPGAYMQGYRSRYTPSGMYHWDRDQIVSIGIKYQDLAEVLFANLQVLHRATSSSYTHAFDYTSAWSYVGTLGRDSSRDMLTLTGDISKGLHRGRTMLTLKPRLTRATSQFVQQGVDYRSTSYSLSPSVEVSQKFGTGGLLSYEVQARFSRSLSERYRTPWVRSLSQKLSYSLAFAKSWELKAQVDYQLVEHARSKFSSYWFGDMSLRYKAKSWELKLSGQNLFDLDRYQQRSYTDLTMSEYSAPLRGRELVLSLSRSF